MGLQASHDLYFIYSLTQGGVLRIYEYSSYTLMMGYGVVKAIFCAMHIVRAEREYIIAAR
ncbi:hypothetical protein PILCRDRAFT_389992 [Piloderma croceum F 1598]|uniref:Uncharacterized protein n=1 Tax=Piloderma croceum (strain F 1598) TaxID=765440 RepID=A0A0C3BE95_PILCF|nr:hypothetical protein PILCRDRAFT_389992 [Piloderma croceum F 1598]